MVRPALDKARADKGFVLRGALPSDRDSPELALAEQDRLRELWGKFAQGQVARS